MKKVLVYSLFVTVMLAFTQDTITFFSTMLGKDSFFSCVDLECEEKESEDSESNGKVNFSDDFYFVSNQLISNLIYNQTERSRYCLLHNKNLSSDYSQEVYFPPELV